MTSWLEAHSLAEALELRRTHPDFVVLAGATDYMVTLPHREAPAGILDIHGVPQLRGVFEEDDGSIRLMAGTTYGEVLRSPVIARDLPALAAACREIGALQIQERGTLGGNLATSSPVGDTLPVWLALDASIELGSVRNGTRSVPYASFVTAYRTTVLAPDELIVAVRIPKEVRGAVQHWRKVGTRRAQAISKVMFAGCARLDGAGRIAHARLALGAIADRPVRILVAEDAMIAEKPDEGLAARVAHLVERSVFPIDDVRSTAEYRRIVAANLVRGFVRSLGS